MSLMSSSGGTEYAVVGDLGGTNVRFWLIKTTNPKSVEYSVVKEQRYLCANFSSLEDMTAQFLKDNDVSKDSPQWPKALCACVAGAVENQEAFITNLKWDVKASVLRSVLGIENVFIMNDFVGVGYGLLGLKPDQYVGLTDAKVQPGAPIAVLGAGTGMGQAYLTHNGSEYKVWPSEGGHSAFAATTVQDMHMVEFIKKDSNVDRVSVERVASGQGMFNIYKFLASVRKEQLSQKHYDAVMKSSTPAKEVNAFAQSGEDPVAVEAMQVFVRALGAEAGDLSLKTLPFGGLFVAGGMAPKVLWAMKQGNRFLQAFKNKGRLSSLLDKVPVYVVTVDEVGLIGCAVVALRLLNQRHDKGSKL